MSESGDKVENEENEQEEAKSYCLLELLDLETELEEESAAVLGGSDDKCCTYNTGYIKRQALYSCLTCCPESKQDLTKAAGICLACSYKCHENHELIELYTKRNFRCDCPTKQIPGSKCLFISTSDGSASTSKVENSKYDKNSSNQYDQNFSGVYCTCKRPYPDPEDPVSDEMIQCIICEDWYHTRHLKSDAIPKTNEYSEMICGDCIERNDFLKYYTGMTVNKVIKLENGQTSHNADEVSFDIIDETEKEKDEIKSEKNGEEIKKASELKDENFEPSCKKLKLEETVNTVDCKKPNMIFDGYKGGAVFWSDDWRQSLCSCINCKKIYAENKVAFLLDPEDTISVYEEKGLKKYHDTYYDWAAKSLSSLGHSQKINLITGYNHLKDKLTDFFDEFSKENKVIKEKDVKDFFKKLNTERLEAQSQDINQYFCR